MAETKTYTYLYIELAPATKQKPQTERLVNPPSYVPAFDRRRDDGLARSYYLLEQRVWRAYRLGTGSLKDVKKQPKHASSPESIAKTITSTFTRWRLRISKRFGEILESK